jgi:hypothetical protein
MLCKSNAHRGVIAVQSPCHEHDACNDVAPTQALYLPQVVESMCIMLPLPYCRKHVKQLTGFSGCLIIGLAAISAALECQTYHQR